MSIYTHKPFESVLRYDIYFYFYYCFLQFTICVHIKYHRIAENNTLLSYFASGNDDELTIFTSKILGSQIMYYTDKRKIKRKVNIHLVSFFFRLDV